MINTSTLSCGVRLITEKMPHVQSVAMGVWVQAGAVFEPTRLAGISHFIEHMMFKGTEKRSAKEIAGDVDRIGGQINAFTGKEATCYYSKTLSANFAKGAEILGDMLLNSVFDIFEIEKEKNVVVEEIKMVQDNPEDDINDVICEEVFHGSSLAKSILGTPYTLRSIKRGAIKTYLRQYYTKENIVIAVAGNFDESEVKEKLEELFSPLPSGKPDLTLEFAEYAPRFKNRLKDIEQCHICLATKSLKSDDERHYAMALLNNVMGGSMSSRLFQNIREQKGLAYSVYSANSAYKEDGYYNIYAGVSPDNVKKAVAAILQELALLGKRGVTTDELSTAKEQMKGNYIFSQESVNGRMFVIGKNYLLLDKVYLPEEVLAKIDKVGMEDMREVAALITDPSRYSGAIVSKSRYDLKRMVNKE
ncbi:MAG: insulinase family protein [Clostridiales Family XIII bacterium]|jgi:predicted Zn-dependent peptidase|nr:insulinase family protein [Clostridiales Family XIII bacterium]